MATAYPGQRGARRSISFSRFGLPWLVIAIPSFIAGLWALLIAARPETMGSAGEARMFAIPAIAIAHTVGGAIASLIGPFQFLDRLRMRHRKLHVWFGRIYLLAVASGAFGGLWLSPGSLAANTFGIAFIALALAWFHTGWMAYAAIRAGDVAAHRRWMIRNFALTYAAPALRIEMPLLIMGGLDPIMALNVVGWTCWVPNLLVVQWWIARRGLLAAAAGAAA